MRFICTLRKYLCQPIDVFDPLHFLRQRHYKLDTGRRWTSSTNVHTNKGMSERLGLRIIISLLLLIAHTFA